MADISQIKIGGVTYDIKDTVARNANVSGIHYRGLGWTHYKTNASAAWVEFTKYQDNIEGIEQIAKSAAGTGAITLANGDLFITGGNTNPDQEYVYDAATETAQRFGTSGTFGGLAFKNSASGTTAGHTHSVTGTGNVTGTAVGAHTYTPEGTIDLSGDVTAVFKGTEDVVDVTVTNENAAVAAHTYTPAGTISAITPTGTIATGSGTANYTPAGTVAAPGVTVADATAGGTVGDAATTGTVTLAEGEDDDFAVTGTVTLSGGSVSAPTFTGTAHTHTFTGTAESHVHTFTPTGTVDTSVANGTGICKASVSGEILTLDSVNITATSTFSGAGGTVSDTSVTPKGTIRNATAGGTVSAPSFTRPTASFVGGKIKATFAGTAHSHTFTGTAHSHTATATAPTFTGTGVQLTFAGTAVTPTFTGTQASLSHAAHTHANTASGTVTPTGFVTVNAGKLTAAFVGKGTSLTHTVTQGSVTISGTAATATDTVTVQ